MSLILAVLAGIWFFSFVTTKEGEKIVGQIGIVILVFGGLAAVIFGVLILQSEQHDKQAQQWKWEHYTGFRLTQSWGGQEQGLFEDKKTGNTCTTLKFPGYPACPEQEFVVNSIKATYAERREGFQRCVDALQTLTPEAVEACQNFWMLIPKDSKVADAVHRGFNECISDPNVTNQTFRHCQRSWLHRLYGGN